MKTTLCDKLGIEIPIIQAPMGGTGEGDIVARSKSLGDVVRYRPVMATPEVEGDIDALSLWAGQGVGLVTKVMSAADIVHEINDDARAILGRLAAED